MSDRKTLLFNYQNNSKNALTKLHKQGFTFLDNNFIWHILIYELEHWDIPTEVVFHNLSSGDIVQYISKYFTKNGLPIKNITLDHSIIPDNLNSDIIKARVKFNGEIWTIHKGDPDLHPSSPHAHNYERQHKLHLGNGKLFRKKNHIGNIRRKHLIQLRERILSQISDVQLPSLEYL